MQKNSKNLYGERERGFWEYKIGYLSRLRVKFCSSQLIFGVCLFGWILIFLFVFIFNCSFILCSGCCGCSQIHIICVWIIFNLLMGCGVAGQPNLREWRGVGGVKSIPPCTQYYLFVPHSTNIGYKSILFLIEKCKFEMQKLYLYFFLFSVNVNENFITMGGMEFEIHLIFSLWLVRHFIKICKRNVKLGFYLYLPEGGEFKICQWRFFRQRKDVKCTFRWISP